MTDKNEGAPRNRRRRTKPKADGSTPAEVPKTSKKDSPPVAANDLFQTASHQARFPKVPDLQRGFQIIVTDLFESGYDVVQEWQDIREGLVIEDALTPVRLKTAANKQEELADRAHQLYIVGKVEVSAYMRETEVTYGAIRNAASEKMEAEKANKTRTKMITDADVKSECARMYPDEWADICTRRERAEAMLAQLLNLAALAKSRCYTVSNMMAPGNRSV